LGSLFEKRFNRLADGIRRLNNADPDAGLTRRFVVYFRTAVYTSRRFRSSKSVELEDATKTEMP
jgi:hypothetical protein